MPLTIRVGGSIVDGQGSAKVAAGVREAQGHSGRYSLSGRYIPCRPVPVAAAPTTSSSSRVCPTRRATTTSPCQVQEELGSCHLVRTPEAAAGVYEHGAPSRQSDGQPNRATAHANEDPCRTFRAMR